MSAKEIHLDIAPVNYGSKKVNKAVLYTNKERINRIYKLEVKRLKTINSQELNSRTPIPTLEQFKTLLMTGAISPVLFV